MPVHPRLQTQARRSTLPGTVPLPPPPAAYTRIDWDWEAEHRDHQCESKADSTPHGAQPFRVDRRALKELVRERACADVARITFLSSGA